MSVWSIWCVSQVVYELQGSDHGAALPHKEAGVVAAIGAELGLPGKAEQLYAECNYIDPLAGIPLLRECFSISHKHSSRSLIPRLDLSLPTPNYSTLGFAVRLVKDHSSSVRHTVYIFRASIY